MGRRVMFYKKNIEDGFIELNKRKGYKAKQTRRGNPIDMCTINC